MIKKIIFTALLLYSLPGFICSASVILAEKQIDGSYEIAFGPKGGPDSVSLALGLTYLTGSYAQPETLDDLKAGSPAYIGLELFNNADTGYTYIYDQSNSFYFSDVVNRLQNSNHDILSITTFACDDSSDILSGIHGSIGSDEYLLRDQNSNIVNFSEYSIDYFVLNLYQLEIDPSAIYTGGHSVAFDFSWEIWGTPNQLAVPIPGTALLLCSGFLVIILMRRMHRHISLIRLPAL